jgi:DNA-binding XRE family transcriptional regulator
MRPDVIPFWDIRQPHSIIHSIAGLGLGRHLLEDYEERYRRFRDRLREARKSAGLTQEEAARRLGKPQSFVSKCESGERRVDFVELLAFVELYGSSVEHFRPA